MDWGGSLAALDTYSWDALGSDLWATARPFLTQLYALAYEENRRHLPVAVAFDVNNPMVRVALRQREKLIRGISDSVFESLKGKIGEAVDRGDSPQQLAQIVREHGVTDSKSRSLTIARTESAVGLNQGAVMAYADAGIEKVTVLDSDADADCAAVNGTTQTLEWAMANPIAHPNCVRGFAPVV